SAVAIVVMRLPESDRAAPTVIAIVDVALHSGELIPDTIILCRGPAEVGPGRRVNELRKARSGRTGVLCLRIPAGLSRDQPIHVRDVPEAQAVLDGPSLTLKETGASDDAALDRLGPLGDEVGHLGDVRLDPLDRSVARLLSHPLSNFAEFTVFLKLTCKLLFQRFKR